MQFINREEELTHLEAEYARKGAKFVVIYGRRRIGKTTLIQKFIEKKERIYYLAAEEKDFQQIEEFKRLLSRKLEDEFLESHTFEQWQDLFSYLKQAWPKERRMILAIDEVTYIIKSNPSFTSYLQKFWDEFLCQTNTFLILSGSLVGLILHAVLEASSPLYGRRTSQIMLSPFRFRNAIRFMKGFGLEDRVKFFGTVGGVAKYLTYVEDSEGFDAFLLDNFFSKEGFFYPEGLFVLSQELKEPSTYVDIMKAIAYGKTKMNEIASFCGIDSKKASSYLDILITLGLVRRIVPITEKEKRFRGGIYQVNDPFLKFWHRFVYPNRSWIELRKKKEIMEAVLPQFQAYFGRVFEDIAREYVELSMPDFPKVGTWWGEHFDDAENKKLAVEIDIVAINEENGGILFGECKWSEDVDALSLLSGLKEKAGHVEWKKNERKESYILFAKSFKRRTADKNAIFVDEKMLAKVFDR